MKRMIPLLTALMLAVLPAQAETWFPDVSGTIIHRDPFCAERSLTLASYFQAAVQYASREVIWAEGEYTICPACDVVSVPVPEESTLYYNPAGGSKLHHDPECPAVSAAYKPLAPITDAEGDIPQDICYCCGPRCVLTPADNRLWGATAEEMALFLPGVWTLPSEDAITPEDAASIARDWAAQRLPDELCTVCPMHYDYGLNVSDQRETYKVIVTTALQHPVCVLYLAAQTGEIYAVERAAEFVSGWLTNGLRHQLQTIFATKNRMLSHPALRAGNRT